MFRRHALSHSSIFRSTIFALVIVSTLILAIGASTGYGYSFLDSLTSLFGLPAGKIESSAKPNGSEPDVNTTTERAAKSLASTSLVISQFDGGGGGTTGTYLYDYIELKNISSSPQSLNGLSLYYGAATGNFASVAANAFALPNVTVNPGQYYLVRLGATGVAGAPLPVAPDATTTNLPMSGTNGKVALVTAGLAINTCGSTATPCDATQLSFIVDWAAYGMGGNGTAGNGEGGTSVNNNVSMTSVQGGVRKLGGCQDTDNNNNDFDVVTAPVPRNSSTAVAPCACACTPTATATSTPSCSPAVWQAGPAQPPARYSIQGSLGSDNKLYIAGGLSSDATPILYDQVSRFDPTTSTWSGVAPMPVAIGQGAMGAWNGKIYVAGGYIGGTSVTNALRIYDIATNAWTNGANVPAGIEAAAGAVVNGKFYVMGGDDFNVPLNTTYIYDIAANSWSSGATLPDLRTNTYGTVANGLIYVYGGLTGASFTATDSLLRYDPVANSWTNLGSAGTGGNGNFGGISPFGPGQLLITSGATSAFVATNTTRIFTISSGTFSAGPNMISARAGHAQATLSDGRVLVADGLDTATTTTSAVELLGVCQAGMPTNTPTASPTQTNTRTPTPTWTATNSPTASPTPASGFVVNTTADTQDAAPGNGTCADAAGACSLRAAITEANALAGADTITVPAGTYTESLVAGNEDANAGGDFDITTPMTINGAGAAATIIQADAAPNTATERLFHVLPGGTAVTISGVTIQNGKAPGAAPDGGRGGGIKVGNNVTADASIVFTLTNSTVQNNFADTRGGGLAINKGNFTINGCTFTGNVAGQSAAIGGAGGAILIDSQDNVTVPGQQGTITNTVMINNKAETSATNSFGGAVILRAQDATVTIDGCTVNNNISNATNASFSGFAGGLYNQQAHMIVRNTAVSGNTSSHFHGGIRNLASTGGAATLDVINSTISNNTVTGDTGQGGGITNILGSTFDATVNVDHSTISGNVLSGATSIGGGLINTGSAGGAALMTVINSTVSGNSAADIGGIYSDGSAATCIIDFSTVANNTANNPVPPAQGGGVFQDTTAGGSTFISNSISADNIAGSDVDVNDLVSSLNYNHIENPNPTFVPGPNDVVGTDPALGPLANNGGPTQTHLPSAGSVVRNTIPNGTNGCGNPINDDQRHQPRPTAGTCDKGSVEASVCAACTPTSTATATATPTATIPPVTAALPNVSASPGALVTVPITVGDTTGREIISYDLQISFNPAIVQPASPAFDQTGTLSSGMSIKANLNNPGHFIISAFTTSAGTLTGAGTLLNLKFNVVATTAQVTTLAFADYTDPNNIFHPRFMFNEGTPPVSITNGSVTVTGPTPTASPTLTATNTATATSTRTPTNTPTPIGGPTPFTITPNPRDFGNVAIRTSSAPVRFNIRNNTNITTFFMTYSLSGPDANSFRTFPVNCGTALSPGSSCSIDITFTPSTVGPKVASFDVYSNSVVAHGSAVLTGNAVANSAFDYDFDGKSDISIFRPSTGEWYLERSTAGPYGIYYGIPGDRPVPADYDGDGKADIAIYRPSEGLWAIFNSSTQTFKYYLFGYEEDLPTPADYDGDRRADISVYRPSSTVWYRQNSSNGQFSGNQFGAAGDRPTIGDYDGDGKSDISVFHPSSGIWYHILSTTGFPYGERFGIASDVLVPADYDGDGRTELAVYRPSTGIWYIKNSSTGMWSFAVFGLSDDIPAPGDYDGDGKADVCVFRPSDGNWYRQNSSNGSFFAFHFGTNGDKPTQAAFRY
jgi:CSLREA domain-containing protein